MNFEAYLTSKKIDSVAFKNAESGLWEDWQKEFDLLHPNSFTAQKLYLINPIRRKYQLKQAPPEILPTTPVSESTTKPASAPAAKPKPMMRPKPKIG